MRMRIIALLAALVLLPAVVFAAPVIVTWEWSLEDPMVTTFRYQLDGEAKDGWTVVDSSVTSYTVEGLDGTFPHTLYLQQSYDGIYYSESAMSVAEPLFPAEEALVEDEIVAVDEVVVEESVTVEATEIEVIAAEEPVAEPIVAEEPAAAPAVAVESAAPVATPEKVKKPKAPSRFYTTISLGGEVGYYFNPPTSVATQWSPRAGLGVQLNNLATFNKNIGLGFDIDLMYSPYPTSTYTWNDAVDSLLGFRIGELFTSLNAGLTVNAGPMINFEFGQVALDLGLGAYGTYVIQTQKILFGAFAKADIEYKVNKWFSFGLSGKYGYNFYDSGTWQTFAESFVMGMLYMGFSF